jgi:serine/threonine protein phosphatase PrpC
MDPMSNFDDDTEPVPIQQAETPHERPYSPPVRVVAAGLSHKGNVREDNQDHYLVARVGRSLDTLVTSLPEGEVPERFDETGFALMVADGMGGAAAGEVASRVAISTLVNIVLDVPDWIMKLDERVADKLISRAVTYYRKVDTTLADLVKADPELQGMGTTMTVGYSIGRDMFVSHVGDSRAYLFRDNKLKQLTRDHTHVQELVEAGMITREEAATHRLRHVLTNAIGGRDREIDVDVQRVRLQDGDRLLFCSDGLTEVVRDDDIADVLGRSKAPEVVCRSLVDLALERGGPDNVTVVTARFAIDG